LAKLSIEDLTRLNLLLSIEGIGPGRIRNLLSKFHTLDGILSADFNTLVEVEGISDNLAKRIHTGRNRLKEMESSVNQELEKLEKLNTSIITVWDREYPALLKKIYDPPLILYVKGELLETDNFSIAIIGTRLPTDYGKIQAEKFSAELAHQNITIVSGMARGIDSAAHWAALKNNGRTIAVIGSEWMLYIRLRTIICLRK
jgi:DNA processing protein